MNLRLIKELSGDGNKWHLEWFNLYIEELIREELHDSEEGVKVGGTLLKALRFADDQVMVAGKRKTCNE